jgi:hypothetical protein
MTMNNNTQFKALHILGVHNENCRRIISFSDGSVQMSCSKGGSDYIRYSCSIVIGSLLSFCGDFDLLIPSINFLTTNFWMSSSNSFILLWKLKPDKTGQSCWWYLRDLFGNFQNRSVWQGCFNTYLSTGK